MSGAVAIDIVEDGFFQPEHSVMPDGTVAHRFRFVTVPDLDGTLMFFRARVGLHDHVIVGASHPRLYETDISFARAALERAYPETFFSFSVESTPGFARLVHDGPHPLEAAAANGAWMCFAAWDESDPILMEVDGVAYAVSVQRLDGKWQATVT